MFNALNRFRPSPGSTNVQDPNFGLVQGQLNEPRRMQLGAKFYWYPSRRDMVARPHAQPFLPPKSAGLRWVSFRPNSSRRGCAGHPDWTAFFSIYWSTCDFF
jgi:hypothetical protein